MGRLAARASSERRSIGMIATSPINAPMVA
jgi:hypothetical protein